jgi:hypothetical protein
VALVERNLQDIAKALKAGTPKVQIALMYSFAGVPAVDQWLSEHIAKGFITEADITPDPLAMETRGEPKVYRYIERLKVAADLKAGMSKEDVVKKHAFQSVKHLETSLVTWVGEGVLNSSADWTPNPPAEEKKK